MMTDIEIAREAKITPIQMIVDKLKIDERYVECYGKFKSRTN